MRKIIVIFTLCTMIIFISGCGQNKIIDGIKYETYGLINKDDNRSRNIKYKLIIGNIVWSVILAETIIAPIYFLGFSIYEPIEKRTIPTYEQI